MLFALYLRNQSLAGKRLEVLDENIGVDRPVRTERGSYATSRAKRVFGMRKCVKNRTLVLGEALGGHHGVGCDRVFILFGC